MKTYRLNQFEIWILLTFGNKKVLRFIHILIFIAGILLCMGMAVIMATYADGRRLSTIEFVNLISGMAIPVNATGFSLAGISNYFSSRYSKDK